MLLSSSSLPSGLPIFMRSATTFASRSKIIQSSASVFFCGNVQFKLDKFMSIFGKHFCDGPACFFFAVDFEDRHILHLFGDTCCRRTCGSFFFFWGGFDPWTVFSRNLYVKISKDEVCLWDGCNRPQIFLPIHPESSACLIIQLENKTFWSVSLFV